MKSQRLITVMIALLIITFCALGLSSFAAEDTKPKKPAGLRKVTVAIDEAIGILDAGMLQNTCYNEGYISEGSFVPALPAGSYKGWSYLPILVPFVGVPEGPWSPKYYDSVKKDSVSMGPSFSIADSYGEVDFGPKAGHRGKLHSGDVVVGDVKPEAYLKNTPLMATSTVPGSWPEDENGERFWPGMWATDPKTGEQIPGRFTSDKEIIYAITDYDLDSRGLVYAERDDYTKQGYALGIELLISGLSYSRSYAEDILFFPTRIINHSKWDYTGVYAGFYFEADIPWYPNHDRMDWMGFIKSEYDAENDTTYAYNMAFTYDYRWGPNWEGTDLTNDYFKPIPAIKLLATPLAPTGEQLGLTDWHWCEWEHRPGHLIAERRELIQYKFVSGDTSGLKVEEDDAYFHPNPEGELDPHFDSPEGVQEEYPDGLDCSFYMSSGPFNLAAGDTATFSFALVIGEDLEDVKRNARTAQFMYEMYYQGADPPKIPQVTAIPADGEVTLYWDSSAEESEDLMTKYRDFEGYKIYRTTINPVYDEWGDKIYDGRGKQVGFVPIEQFDLVNGIKDEDPKYPHLWLGSDTGLKHSWTDNTVKNGVTYWYSVISYDRGIREDSLLNPNGWDNMNSLECGKGTNPDSDPNLVMVVPHKTPENYVGPTIEVVPLPGSYNGNITVATLIDEFAVTGHSYLISFDDTTSAQVKFYDVYHENTEQYVARDKVNSPEGPIFDGLQLIINELYTKATFVADSAYWYYQQPGTASECNYTINGDLTKDYQFDYEFRFTAQGDTGFYPLNYAAPFEIWNITTDTTADFCSLQPNPKDTTAKMVGSWTDGDVITLREKVQGKTVFTWTFNLGAPPLKYDTLSVVFDTTGIDTAGIAIVDTIYNISVTDTSVAPKTGDVARIVSGKPFVLERDLFRIETQRYTTREVSKEDLRNIRVVPNPYIVTAEWDLDPYVKQLAFTNLPSECDIHIYTLRGERVQRLHHRSETDSWEYWNMLTFNGQEIAYGLYIYVVKTPQGDTKAGKFAVIK